MKTPYLTIRKRGDGAYEIGDGSKKLFEVVGNGLSWRIDGQGVEDGERFPDAHSAIHSLLLRFLL